MPVPLRADFDARREGGGQAFERWSAGAATAGAGGDLRGDDALRGGQDRRRDPSDRSRLGEFNARGPEGADRSQGARATCEVERHTPAALAEIIESGPMPAV